MLESPKPVVHLTATVGIHDPDDPDHMYEVVTVCARSTRQRLGSNRRCSLYKHTVEFTIHPGEVDPINESVVFTARSHPRVDTLDLLQVLPAQDLLRARPYQAGEKEP